MIPSRNVGSRWTTVLRWLGVLALCAGMPGELRGQAIPLLLKEEISREFSVHVGGVDEVPGRELASREYSLRVENGSLDDLHGELVSREFGIIVADPDAPPPVVELVATPSATGDSVVLDWSSYNQWAVGDIARFDIYFTDDGAFTDVTGMTPYASLPADSTTLTLDGLAEFTDHYFALVAVDALGNANPLVEYSAGVYHHRRAGVAGVLVARRW